MAEVPKELVPQHHAAGSGSVLSLPKSEASTVRSARAPPPSTLKTVVTAPPWARDEPPSPTGSLLSPADAASHSHGRPSDVSSQPPNSAVSWSSFAPRPSRPPAPAPAPAPQADAPAAGDGLPPPRASFMHMAAMSLALRDRSRSWLGGGITRRSEDAEKPAVAAAAEDGSAAASSEDSAMPLRPARMADRGLTIRMPSAHDPASAFTMHQARTPGWQSPWTPRDARASEHTLHAAHTHADDSPRRRAARSFLLNNIYVPLLFRFINITFTAAALGVAIRIRIHEMEGHIRGVLGSSPLLVIIFAPLTLTHVLSAIYLEYFGRPLGLWRTSHKLAHTLFEVALICAWAAALSLCFDNFFTSPLPCASLHAIAWYNELPRAVVNFGGVSEAVRRRLCDDQVFLIVLVGIGLLMYCMNLVISLYRIFEKVKHHQRGWDE